MAANGRAFVLLGNWNSQSSLGRSSQNNITAKLLQMIRITNADGRYS